jgi:hypothetical protein
MIFSVINKASDWHEAGRLWGWLPSLSLQKPGPAFLCLPPLPFSPFLTADVWSPLQGLVSLLWTHLRWVTAPRSIAPGRINGSHLLSPGSSYLAAGYCNKNNCRWKWQISWLFSAARLETQLFLSKALSTSQQKLHSWYISGEQYSTHLSGSYLTLCQPVTSIRKLSLNNSIFALSLGSYTFQEMLEFHTTLWAPHNFLQQREANLCVPQHRESRVMRPAKQKAKWKCALILPA